MKEYISSRPRTGLVLAAGFVIGSFSQRLAAKIYLKLNKPEVPTGFFLCGGGSYRVAKGVCSEIGMVKLDEYNA